MTKPSPIGKSSQKDRGRCIHGEDVEDEPSFNQHYHDLNRLGYAYSYPYLQLYDRG